MVADLRISFEAGGAGELLRIKPCVSSCSRSRSVRLVRMDVTERRRLCTTPCIFGNIDLRTAWTNCSRGAIAELVLTGLLEFFAEREGVVMRLGGRISWNVDFCFWGGLLGIDVDDDSGCGGCSGRVELSWIVKKIENVPDANAFGLERDTDVVEVGMGVRTPYSAPASPWYSWPLQSRKVNFMLSLSYPMRLNPSGRRSAS